jgi:hypothetical protein
VDVLLNKESKRETPSVVTFTAKQRMMGTDAGTPAQPAVRLPWPAALPPCLPSQHVTPGGGLAAKVTAQCLPHQASATAHSAAMHRPSTRALRRRYCSALPAAGGMATNPRNTVSQLKRLMGKKYSDPQVQQDLHSFPFKVAAGPNGECLFEVGDDAAGISCQGVRAYAGRAAMQGVHGDAA